MQRPGWMGLRSLLSSLHWQRPPSLARSLLPVLPCPALRLPSPTFQLLPAPPPSRPTPLVTASATGTRSVHSSDPSCFTPRHSINPSHRQARPPAPDALAATTRTTDLHEHTHYPAPAASSLPFPSLPFLLLLLAYAVRSAQRRHAVDERLAVSLCMHAWLHACMYVCRSPLSAAPPAQHTHCHVPINQSIQP